MATNFGECSFEEHGEAILAIFNDAIATSTALYEYQPRTMNTMRAWFEAKALGGFPVVGAFDEQGVLLGFGSFGSFRPQPAYKYTVEHSVYVHKEHRGKGLARVLVNELIGLAKERELHSLIGVIDSENTASIGLHESLGFIEVGRIPQVGFKFGLWLDVVLMQLVLPTPAEPVDG